MRFRFGRPGRETCLCIGLAAILAVCVFVANLPVEGPMIQADEGSHLANAAAIAGFPNDMASSYHAGYSFLIAPAFWLADSPQQIWTVVKAINAFLFFVAVLMLWLLSRRLRPEASLIERVCAVALVSLYPMWVVMAGYSFAQIAFVPLFLIAVLAFYRAAQGGPAAWLGLGICTGYLYWIHPAGLAVAIAAVIAGGYLSLRQRAYWSFAALLLSITGMVLSYQYGVTPWLHSRMTISGLSPSLHYPDSSELLSPLLSFEGLKAVISRTGGHLFYLSVGTVGLLWAGLVSLGKRSIRTPAAQSSEAPVTGRAVPLFLVLSLVGVLALSVLLFSSTPEAQRLDHWMYGRYVGGVIAPILLAGTLSASLRRALWAVPIALLGAILLSTGLNTYTHIAYFNISAFWQVFPLAEQGLWWWLIAGCLLIVVVAAVPRRVGMLLIAAVFVYSSVLQIGWHVSNSEAAIGRWDAALTVRDEYPAGTCVGFDHSGIDTYHREVFWSDYGFVLFDYQLQRMTVEQWLESCDGPLFTYDRSLDKRLIDVYPIASGTHGGPWLLVKGIAPKIEYPLRVTERSVALLSAIGNGWHELESHHIWSSEEAELHLPIPDSCYKGGCSARIFLSAYGASANREVEVIVETYVNDDRVLRQLVFSSTEPQAVLVPLSSEHAHQLVSIKVPEAVSPKALEGGTDSRVLGVSFSMIELVRTGAIAVTEAGLMIDDFEGFSLSQVGMLQDGALISTGDSGYLAYGPYVCMNAGEYQLVVRGVAPSVSSAWVDVVSAEGTVKHAEFALTPAGVEEGVLASGHVTLEQDVTDLEVRIWVGADDEVRLDGYELVRAGTAGSTSAEN